MKTLESDDIGLDAIRERLAQSLELNRHTQVAQLIEIISGETNISTAGFPYISDRSFRIFIEEVPHLFEHGASILNWLHTLEKELDGIPNAAYGATESINRAIKVLRTIVFTAGVTAIPDLWLLRQVFSTHKEFGTIDWLLSQHTLDLEEYARENNLSFKQLKTDVRFLYARGYLRTGDDNFLISNNTAVANVLKEVTPLKSDYRTNMVPHLVEWFSRKDAEKGIFLREWLRIDVVDSPTRSWIASYFQIELGYRLLPLVLSLRVLDITAKLKQDVALEEHVPNLTPEMKHVFECAGYLENGKVNELGARVFERGPGPIGIIGAYHPYLAQLDALLKSEQVSTWVRRAENVAASQDANRKTFQAANDQLDRFCRKYHFAYAVFVEHAVGQGEATRQRFLRDGEEGMRYFGADLEDAAIDQALKQQALGFLPRNMQFIRKADIGEPQRVIQHLQQEGLADAATVMMVGNGFHEIRGQTNEKMIEVFEAYQKAGFVLIFTEESALHDEALIQTAWNTYHAGFRYVHEVSGQGLRPAVEREGSVERWSWRKCAMLGGYVVLDEFSYRSRTIYPYKRPKHKNPSISVTYFCVPHKTAIRLDVDVD